MNKVQKDLKARIERTEKLLEQLREAEELAKKKQYYYRVTLVSAWSDYGEVNGVGTGKTIPEATKAARADFREKNSRKDIQSSATYVRAIFDNGFEMNPHQIL